MEFNKLKVNAIKKIITKIEVVQSCWDFSLLLYLSILMIQYNDVKCKYEWLKESNYFQAHESYELNCGHRKDVRFYER